MRLASALALTLASAALAFAASPKTKTALSSRQHAPDPSIATLHVTTRETIVDVTVVDDHGNPVHNLKREDFTIKEDGKEQPIRSFNEFGKQTIAAPPKLPPNTYTNLQPPAAGPVNILLLDFANAAPVLSLSCCGVRSAGAGAKDLVRATGRQRMIKQEAMRYLQNMPTGTRVAVLGTSYPGSLRILQGVTSDTALLSAAIDGFAYDTDGLVDIPHPLAIWCAQQDRRNRSTLEALDQIAASAAGIKGRKNLLWFTIGIPTITDAASSPACLPAPDHLPDYTPALQKAYGLLATAQVTVFPITARGLTTMPKDIVSDTVIVGSGNSLTDSSAEELLSMESVAEATGGSAYYNSNDLAKGIAKAIDLGSDYYTITYATPDTEYDGRHHKINVKVNQEHLHLAYREGYYSEDPTKLVPTPGLALAANIPEAAPKSSTQPADPAAAMRLAMTHAISNSTAILFDAQVEPTTEPAKATDPAIFGFLDVKFKTKHLTRYGVEFAFPARQIAFTTGPDNTHRGALEFDVAAFDSEGHLINSLSQTMQLPLSDSAFQQMQSGPFRFFQQLDLPPGPAFLRIGIHDLTSNKIGTLEVPLTVPKTPPDRAGNQPTPPTK